MTSRRRQTDPFRPLRYLWRVPLLLVHAVVGLPLVMLAINPLFARLRRRDDETWDQVAIRWWSWLFVRIFGMRLRRVGTPLRGGALFVANHVSWIDINVLLGVRSLGFVAKAEIARWPLIGWLASRGGTIYHHRGDNDSLHGVMHQMLQRLEQGKGVGVFPEGRTCDGREIRPFHARILQPAVLANAPVQPVALKYGAGGCAQTTVAFRPGENFIQNLWRVLAEPVRDVEVHFLAPVQPEGEGRRKLSDVARARIVAAMQA